MGAIVNGLRGSELDTGIDPKLILPLSNYWEQVWKGGGLDLYRQHLRPSSQTAHTQPLPHTPDPRAVRPL